MGGQCRPCWGMRSTTDSAVSAAGRWRRSCVQLVFAAALPLLLPPLSAHHPGRTRAVHSAPESSRPPSAARPRFPRPPRLQPWPRLRAGRPSTRRPCHRGHRWPAAAPPPPARSRRSWARSARPTWTCCAARRWPCLALSRCVETLRRRHDLQPARSYRHAQPHSLPSTHLPPTPLPACRPLQYVVDFLKVSGSSTSSTSSTRSTTSTTSSSQSDMTELFSSIRCRPRRRSLPLTVFRPACLTAWPTSAALPTSPTAGAAVHCVSQLPVL